MADSKEAILETIAQTLGDIVDADALELHRDTVADDVDDWDSINHVKLLIALESHYGIRFSAIEVEKLQTVGDLVDAIHDKTR